MKRSSVLIFAAVALAVLPACSFTELRETVHQSVPVSGSPTVRVDNSVGGVKIRAWEKPMVDVVAVKDAHSADGLKNISIDIEKRGSNVIISTVNKGSGSFWGGGGVGYTIMVPANSSLNITNGTGGVSIRGVHGNVVARGSTGGMEANLGKVGGNRVIDMSVTTGGIDVTIARDSNATIDMHSSVGGTSSAFPSGRVGSGSAKIHLQTTTGGVDLHAS